MSQHIKNSGTAKVSVEMSRSDVFGQVSGPTISNKKKSCDQQEQNLQNLMILLAIIGFLGGPTIADLTPPFFQTEQKQVGVWDFGGVSTIYEDKIILAPPIQYHQGSAWSHMPIPSTNWSALFEFGIEDGTGGGAIGIWIINQFGINESITNKEPNITGIVVLAHINKDKIEIQLAQPEITNNFTVPIINSGVILYLSFSSGSVTIGDIDPETKEINNQITCNLTTKLSDKYLGVTAQSDEYTSLITIRRITFDIGSFSGNEIHNIANEIISADPHVVPKILHRLRNPMFVSMRTELEEYEKNRGNLNFYNSTTLNELLAAIDEIAEVNDDVATFNDLMDFVQNTITPFTQSWHKRTNKIVEYAEKAKEMTEEACKSVSLIANEFTSIKNQTLVKTELKLASIQRELLQSVINISVDNSTLVSSMALTEIRNIFLIIGVIETVFVIIFELIKIFVCM